MKIKILSVCGTRPQCFKLDPKLSDVVINTGQHADENMSDVHFKDMKIKPKYNLGCSSDEFGKMIDKIREVLQKETPDVVLVYGDTYSTLAGSLAASMENIPLGHVEAGLRAHDRSIPEETNRVVSDILARWKFAPTHDSMKNLLEEGLGLGAYHVPDPLFWSFNYFVPLKREKDYGKFVFATIHRRENLDKENLSEIIRGFSLIPEKIYFPVHPHTLRMIKKYGIKIPKNVEVVKPQPRKQTLQKIHNSKYVITDSGGIQREAYWMMRHSFIIRPVSEWVEIVEKGWSTLVGANAERLAEIVSREYKHGQMPELPRGNPYEKIKDILKGGI